MQPSEHKRLRDFAAKERELVFDIDLTDYDDVRTCCQSPSPPPPSLPPSLLPPRGCGWCPGAGACATSAGSSSSQPFRSWTGLCGVRLHIPNPSPPVELVEVFAEDFGFKHILFVYSGRRGVHAWVCDATARKLANDGRSAVAEYLQIITVRTTLQSSAVS